MTVYTGNENWAGTDARVFVELFGQNAAGQSQNSGEAELAGKKSAFEKGGWVHTTYPGALPYKSDGPGWSSEILKYQT